MSIRNYKNYVKFLSGLILLALLLSSCERFGKDDIAEKSDGLSAFNTLRVDGPVNVYLSMDTANSITIRGNPAIVDNIRYGIVDGVLTLRSEYPYKMFIPSSNKADIFLKITSLKRIEIAEASGIKSTGTITGDELGLVVMAKYADIDLNVNCHTFYYWDYSLSGGRISLAGETKELKIWNFSLMTVDASALESEKVICDNNGRSPCYVRAMIELDYNIRGQGNIYYYGDPSAINAGEISSSGKLIRAD